MHIIACHCINIIYTTKINFFMLRLKSINILSFLFLEMLNVLMFKRMKGLGISLVFAIKSVSNNKSK